MKKEYVNIDWYSCFNNPKFVARGLGGLNKIKQANAGDCHYVQGPGGYVSFWLTDEESEEEIIVRLNAEIEFWSLVDQG